MKRRKWMIAMGTAVLMLLSVAAVAKEHGRGKGKHKGGPPAERYSDQDHDAIRTWYAGRHGNLPPGLAKRDELPPGLEQQLVVRGTLPPGLRKKMHRCPRDLARLLPPPPPDCRHVLIGGNIVLINRRTFMILDIFRVAL